MRVKLTTQDRYWAAEQKLLAVLLVGYDKKILMASQLAGMSTLFLNSIEAIYEVSKSGPMQLRMPEVLAALALLHRLRPAKALRVANPFFSGTALTFGTPLHALRRDCITRSRYGRSMPYSTKIVRSLWRKLVGLVNDKEDVTPAEAMAHVQRIEPSLIPKVAQIINRGEEARLVNMKRMARLSLKKKVATPKKQA
jgi:hypothetical protein